MLTSKEWNSSTTESCADAVVSNRHIDSEPSSLDAAEMFTDIDRVTAMILTDGQQPAVDSRAVLRSQTVSFVSRQAVPSGSVLQDKAKPASTVPQHEATPTEPAIQRECTVTEVLSTEALSVHQAVPTGADFQQKAEPELQHIDIFDTGVQNEAISTDTVLQHDRLNEAISTDNPIDVLQHGATPIDTMLQRDPEPADDVLKQKVVPTNDELRFQVVPSDTVSHQKAEPDGTVLRDKAVPDDIKHDNDYGLLPSVESYQSKDGLDDIEEQHVNTGFVTSDTAVSYDDNMDSTVSTVECNEDCLLERGNDSVNIDVSRATTGLELAASNSRTADDNAMLDAVQSAELPARRTMHSAVESNAVNEADCSNSFNTRDVDDSADVYSRSSRKQPIDEYSLTGNGRYITLGLLI